MTTTLVSADLMELAKSMSCATYGLSLTADRLEQEARESTILAEICRRHGEPGMACNWDAEANRLSVTAQLVRAEVKRLQAAPALHDTTTGGGRG